MRAYKRASRRGFTVIELLITVAIIVVVVAGAGAFAGGGCSDIVYPRDLHGQVGKTGARMARSGSGMQEKFALSLHNITLADAATRESAQAGPSTLNVECLSTQCALLDEGQCVQLECNRIVRWWEPNVVQCKLKHIVQCP